MKTSSPSNILTFWLKTAEDYDISKTLTTNTKKELLNHTSLTISQILKGTPLDSQKLTNKIIKNFCKLDPNQNEKIIQLVSEMGERGLKKLDQLFHVITEDPQGLSNFSTIKFLALKEPLATSEEIIGVTPDRNKINEFRKTLRDQLILNRKNSNKKEGFLPLSPDIIHHLKSNYLDEKSLINLNRTIKNPDVLRADLISLLNQEKITPKDLKIYTLDDYINFLGEDIEKITRLAVCPFEGIVEHRSPEQIMSRHTLSTQLLQKIIENFPNLNKLFICTKLDHEVQTLLSKNEFEELKKLEHIKEICFGNLKGVTSLDFLKNFPKLTHLKIHHCLDLGTIDASKHFAALKTLKLEWFKQIEGLNTLENLETLSLVANKEYQFFDISLLKDLKILELKSIALPANNSKDGLVGLSNLINLEEIELDLHYNDASIPLDNLKNLQKLSLSHCAGKISGLDKLPLLRGLMIKKCERLKDYSFLSKIPNMQSLIIYNIDDLSAQLIGLLKDLRRLIIKEHLIVNFNFLKKLKKIKYLDLSGSSKFSDVNTLKDAKLLKHLNLNNCNVRNIQGLRLLPLSVLKLAQNKHLEGCDLSVLKNIPTLKSLNLDHIGTLDLAPLREHPSLEKIRLINNTLLHPDVLLEIPLLKYVQSEKTNLTCDELEKIKEKGIKSY